MEINSGRKHFAVGMIFSKADIAARNAITMHHTTRSSVWNVVIIHQAIEGLVSSAVPSNANVSRDQN